MQQYATLEDTVYLWFGSNDTGGSGDDGASPVYDVRLGGAAAGAIPTLSGSATLLSHANYPAGCHEVAIAATAANGFAAGNTYGVFCTLLVDSQNPTGFVGSFTLGPVPADAIEISGDSTAANNMELQYDGTGLDGDTFPATQAQLTGIANVGAATNEHAIASPNGFVITTGSNEVNTEDVTHADQGTVHSIEDNGGTLDVHYVFDIGGAFTPVTVTWNGRLNSSNDDVTVYANTGTLAVPAWEERSSVSGTNLSTNLSHKFTLYIDDTMTGADAGKVALRFYGTGLTSATLSTDQITTQKTSKADQTGYTNGSVHFNDTAGNTSTVVDVDGTARNPVSTWAAIKTLVASTGLKQVHSANDSTVTLDADSSKHNFLGWEWTLALGNQSIAGCYINGAAVTGIGTGTAARFFYCKMGQGGTATLAACGMKSCALSGSIVLTSAGTYLMDGCFQGTTLPDIDFGAAVGNTTVLMEHHSGAIEIKNLGANGTDVLNLVGNGELTLSASCVGGTVNIQGNWEITNNGSGMTINDDARIDVGQIKAEADSALSDYGALKPTAAGRTLDVAATGEAGLDFDNVKNASAPHTLTNTTVPTVTTVGTTTANSDMRGTDGANTVTPDASGTAAGLHGTTDGLIGGLNDFDGTGGTLHGDYDASKTASQAGDAMDLVADAVDAAAVKADAVTKIQSGLATEAKQDIVDGVVDDVKAVTEKLDTAMVQDGAVYDFTAPALAAAPAGSGLNAQQTRDAMKLAPTAGAPAAGSVDKHLDSIVEDTGTTGVKLADNAITAGKYDESTAYPVKSADTGSSKIARTGADGDTLEDLSDQIDAIVSGQPKNITIDGTNVTIGDG